LHLAGFIIRNLSRCMVTWTSNRFDCLYIIYWKENLCWHLEFISRPPAILVNEGPQVYVKICNQS